MTPDEAKGKCPIEYAVSLLSGKWKILIVKELAHGPVRYGALAKAIPAVSAKVLTQQLREMEAEGLVERVIYPEVPPRVEYSMSEMGYSMAGIVKEMRRWAMSVNRERNVRCSMCRQCEGLMP